MARSVVPPTLDSVLTGSSKARKLSLRNARSWRKSSWPRSCRRNATYASGNFGKSLVGSFVEIFALFYLTDLLNVPPALAGMILLFSLIWDGVTDPVMGIVAERLDMSIFSLYTLINKICMGLSQALTGLVLAVFGYQANSDIPIETIGAIVTTLLALPAIGSLGCIYLLRHQTLRQSRH